MISTSCHLLLPALKHPPLQDQSGYVVGQETIHVITNPFRIFRKCSVVWMLPINTSSMKLQSCIFGGIHICLSYKLWLISCLFYQCTSYLPGAVALCGSETSRWKLLRKTSGISSKCKKQCVCEWERWEVKTWGSEAHTDIQ